MIQTLEDLLKSEPFVEFRIVLASGSFYDVRSPYQVIVKVARITYFYERSDRIAYLNGIDISALETLGEEQRV